MSGTGFSVDYFDRDLLVGCSDFAVKIASSFWPVGVFIGASSMHRILAMGYCILALTWRSDAGPLFLMKQDLRRIPCESQVAVAGISRPPVGFVYAVLQT